MLVVVLNVANRSSDATAISDGRIRSPCSRFSLKLSKGLRLTTSNRGVRSSSVLFFFFKLCVIANRFYTHKNKSQCISNITGESKNM